MKIMKLSTEESSTENNEFNKASFLSYSAFMGISIMQLFILVSDLNYY